MDAEQADMEEVKAESRDTTLQENTQILIG